MFHLLSACFHSDAFDVFQSLFLSIAPLRNMYLCIILYLLFTSAIDSLFYFMSFSSYSMPHSSSWYATIPM